MSTLLEVDVAGVITPYDWQARHDKVVLPL
jgi:hypothetical protein